MGFMSGKPTPNEPPKKSGHPWAEETECMDVFALALNGHVKRCKWCRRWARQKHLFEGNCPDCRELQVGHRVTHKHPSGLHCDSGVYPHAYITQTDPKLILVSEEGDMWWSCTIEIEDLIFDGYATEEEMVKPMKRFNKDKENQQQA